MKKFFSAVIAMMMTMSVSAQFYIYLSNGEILQTDSISTVFPGMLSGEFSVSATTKVHFSKGNLQYVGTWQFAEHQWDIIGDAQADNNRDLFGWGTGDAPNKVSSTSSDYSTFTDWGTNAITNGGNTANMWRTLTKDEWGYLFETRTDAVNKYGAAKVNDIPGVVLLPDNWTLPSGCGFTAGMLRTNSWDGVASTNMYDANKWSKMESAGAVFLPAAGYRGSDGGVGYVGSYGFYWSSIPYGSFSAYDLYFDSIGVGVYDNGRCGGLSVRLVR